MNEKRTVIKVPRQVVQMVERLRSENELLKDRVKYQGETIDALRDVIQTFQAEANYRGAIFKQGTSELVKATNNGQ